MRHFYFHIWLSWYHCCLSFFRSIADKRTNNTHGCKFCSQMSHASEMCPSRPPCLVCQDPAHMAEQCYKAREAYNKMGCPYCLSLSHGYTDRSQRCSNRKQKIYFSFVKRNGKVCTIQNPHHCVWYLGHHITTLHFITTLENVISVAKHYTHLDIVLTNHRSAWFAMFHTSLKTTSKQQAYH